MLYVDAGGMDTNEKKPYEDKAKKDKARYEKEMESYEPK